MSIYVKETTRGSCLCTSTADIANTVTDLIFVAELESIRVSQVITVSKGLKLSHSVKRNKDEKYSQLHDRPFPAPKTTSFKPVKPVSKITDQAATATMYCRSQNSSGLM